MGVTVQSQGPGGKVVVSVEKRAHSTRSECLSSASTRPTTVRKAGRGSVRGQYRGLAALQQELMSRRNQALFFLCFLNMLFIYLFI